MRVIPVIDLLGGQVVRGVAGRRDEYRPIVSQIAAGSDPATVARAFVERFGFDTAYVADLDAIMHQNLNEEAWQQIAQAGLKLWLDAGVGSDEAAGRVFGRLRRANVNARLVIGLESLHSEDDYRAIARRLGDQPPIFSLDLKQGQPLVRNEAWRGLSPLEIALLARSMGAQEIIVLDLADVGINAGGSTRELCRQIALRCQPRSLIAGGGVRGPIDLLTLARAGCDGVLVASALHDGRLTRTDVEQIHIA